MIGLRGGEASVPATDGRPILFVASVGTTLGAFVAPLARSLQSSAMPCVAAAGSLASVDGFDRHHELPGFRRAGPLRVLEAYRRLYEVARAETPCLLHLHSPPALVLGRLVARRLKIQSVAVVHGTFLEPASYRGAVFAATEAVLARLATRTAVLNEDDARFYRRFALPGSVSVAPVGGMGIDLTRMRAAMAQPVAIAPSPSIVVLGRLTPEKNLDMIVDAFREVRRRHGSASLTFVGSALPGDRPWEVPAGEGIAHMRWLANPYPVLSGADLLVTASRREGFPMVIAEALLAGVPVVSVTNRGARQIKRAAPGDQLTVVANNPQALTEGVLSSLALNEPGSREDRLAQMWSQESAIGWHTALINEVLASPAATVR
jgi:glycosyltransferase involved in cell wall biosynthesis